MIKKAIYFISAIMITAVLISLSDKPQEPEFVVRGTFQEWQIILSNQDDVAKSMRDKVVQKFASQINDQIKLIDSLAKQKAIQDSLKKKN